MGLVLPRKLSIPAEARILYHAVGQSVEDAGTLGFEGLSAEDTRAHGVEGGRIIALVSVDGSPSDVQRSILSGSVVCSWTRVEVMAMACKMHGESIARRDLACVPAFDDFPKHDKKVYNKMRA